jgi:hypothetical protein
LHCIFYIAKNRFALRTQRKSKSLAFFTLQNTKTKHEKRAKAEPSKNDVENLRNEQKSHPKDMGLQSWQEKTQQTDKIRNNT